MVVLFTLWFITCFVLTVIFCSCISFLFYKGEKNAVNMVEIKHVSRVMEKRKGYLVKVFYKDKSISLYTFKTRKNAEDFRNFLIIKKYSASKKV